MIDSKSILIVDDHQMFRDSLAFLIKKTFPNTVVETGDSHTSLVNKLRSSRSFDVVLIDLNMPACLVLRPSTNCAPNFRAIAW